MSDVNVKEYYEEKKKDSFNLSSYNNIHLDDGLVSILHWR
jgi:hypothetical protein